MNTNKVLAGMSYLSIFFAGFIFPLVVFLVTTSPYVKQHAKKAFLSHLIPIIPVPFLVGAAVYLDFTNQLSDTTPIYIIVGALLTGLIAIIVTIWNLVKAIKVFANEDY
ncbi:DUF4870 domain-containing protein [Robertmurraya korlensis]|uniref:DUF4870 domain-containing protein n=1 Tax=Robertmurraya korlensis TaxID=519977 RepID=UPI0008255E5C|nr:DUF4870 domain-containing protein [Robertmurraya korlensis]